MSTFTVDRDHDRLEKEPHPFNQAHTNLNTSCGRVTNQHSRTPHPKISGAILLRRDIIWMVHWRDLNSVMGNLPNYIQS